MIDAAERGEHHGRVHGNDHFGAETADLTHQFLAQFQRIDHHAVRFAQKGDIFYAHNFGGGQGLRFANFSGLRLGHAWFSNADIATGDKHIGRGGATLHPAGNGADRAKFNIIGVGGNRQHTGGDIG